MVPENGLEAGRLALLHVSVELGESRSPWTHSGEAVEHGLGRLLHRPAGGVQDELGSRRRLERRVQPTTTPLGIDHQPRHDPSAATTRPHRGNRIEPISRSTTSNNLAPPLVEAGG